MSPFFHQLKVCVFSPATSIRPLQYDRSALDLSSQTNQPTVLSGREGEREKGKDHVHCIHVGINEGSMVCETKAFASGCWKEYRLKIFGVFNQSNLVAWWLLSQFQLKIKRLVKLDHLPNIPWGGVTHICIYSYSKNEMFETRAQLSCAKLFQRDGPCRPVLHENSVASPETNQNNSLQSKGKEFHHPSFWCVTWFLLLVSGM